MVDVEIAVVNCKNCWDCINGGNHSGLHARPSAIFSQSARSFNCDIKLKSGKYINDGKSMMGVMTLDAKPRDIIKIICSGKDETSAITELSDVLIYRTGDKLCSQFKDFRISYAIEKGFTADGYKKIESLDLLKAFVIFIKNGNICVRRTRKIKK